MSDNDERTCGICTNEYGGSVVPTILMCCLHHVCFGCAEKDRAAKISALTGNKKKIKCMMCNQLFHSSKDTPWKVNKPFINVTGIEVDMCAVKEAQDAMQMTASSNRNLNTRPMAMEVGYMNETEVEEENSNALNLDAASPDQTKNEPQVCSPSPPATLCPRRSQWLQREDTLQDCDDEDDESRFSYNSEEDQSEYQIEDNTSYHATEGLSLDRKCRSEPAISSPDDDEDGVTSSGTKLSVIVNGMKYSEESIDDPEEAFGDLDDEAKIWLREVSNDGLNVYRIRAFQGHSRCNTDKFGRKCSFWCIKYGYVVSSPRMLTVLPKEIQGNGETCKDYVRSMGHNNLLESCRTCKSFSDQKGVTYAHTYRYFIEMKPGDIVVMQVRGKKGGTPRPYLVFGVVQDDSLILMRKDEAINKHNFPWDFKMDGIDLLPFENGIMLRNVKWYRQGVLQDVRGPSQADWILENVTKWLARVDAGKEELLKKAVNKMSSNAFFDATKKIDDDWIAQGLTGL